MHRNMLPAAITLSMNTRNLKVTTYHGVLVSLGNVLHFICNGRRGNGGWFRRRMIWLSVNYAVGSYEVPLMSHGSHHGVAF
jgi:hypothetical protein